MTTTTTYGTWYNVTGSNLTPAADIQDVISGGDQEWREAMADSGALDAAEAEWRASIDAALPNGVSLCGNEFYGPAKEADCDFEGYPVDEDGDLDLAAIIDAIDLNEIIERHDVDNQPTVTVADVRALLASGADEPVLYLKLDGDTPEVDVWAAALVNHHQVITTRHDAEDALGENPDSEAIEGYLELLQNTVDEILAARA